LIQTCTPDHPAIAAAALNDAAAFLEYETTQRRAAGYPPYARLAAIQISGREEAAVEGAAEAIAATLRADAEARGVEILGPAPQMLSRLRGQHRWHLLIRGTAARAVREAAERALDSAERGGK